MDHMDTVKKLGAYLRKLRGCRSLDETAAALRITADALRAYEEDRRIPRDEVVLRAAAYYGVPVVARNGRIFICSVQAAA